MKLTGRGGRQKKADIKRRHAGMKLIEEEAYRNEADRNRRHAGMKLG
jgi:hypothetical protein